MSRTRRTTIVILVLIVLPLVVLGGGASWFWWQVSSCGGGAPAQVQINQGWGVPRIGDELHKRGLIGSSLVFSVYSRLNGHTHFQAGTYVLHKHMCVRDAVRLLNAGPKIKYVKLTIPPGFWITETAKRVAKLPGLSAEKFLEATKNNAVRSAFEPANVHNLEGLLWPDTYAIDAEEDEIKVAFTMAQEFDKKASALGLANANVQGHSAYDIIIVASLIESEAKTARDPTLFASVIYNRLSQPMPLQIDATLIYARGDPLKRSLSTKDTQIVSPYNTYAHSGLPPTPIAAVSAASLQAALVPAQTTFLYYVVADKQGNHAFASTLSEHEANIAKAKAAGVLP